MSYDAGESSDVPRSIMISISRFLGNAWSFTQQLTEYQCEFASKFNAWSGSSMEIDASLPLKSAARPGFPNRSAVHVTPPLGDPWRPFPLTRSEERRVGK